MVSWMLMSFWEVNDNSDFSSSFGIAQFWEDI